MTNSVFHNNDIAGLVINFQENHVGKHLLTSTNFTNNKIVQGAVGFQSGEFTKKGNHYGDVTVTDCTFKG